MKKYLFLMLIFVGLIITGCSSSKLKNLSLEDLNNKINNKETFVVYFDVEESALKEKFEKVVTDNNIEGYIIKANKLTDEEKTKLQPIISYESSAIVFIIDGKDPSVLSHVTNSNTTVKEIELRLKNMNYIK